MCCLYVHRCGASTGAQKTYQREHVKKTMIVPPPAGISCSSSSLRRGARRVPHQVCWNFGSFDLVLITPAFVILWVPVNLYLNMQHVTEFHLGRMGHKLDNLGSDDQNGEEYNDLYSSASQIQSRAHSLPPVLGVVPLIHSCFLVQLLLQRQWLLFSRVY